MFVGNGAAIFRPREPRKEDEVERAPVGRSAIMALVGLVAAIWAIATLVS